MSRRRETQASISAWAEKTFGSHGSNLEVAKRAQKEMTELLKKLRADDRHPGAAEETADVVIVLMRLMTRLRDDLAFEIDRKMRINRGRVWKLDGKGNGQHVKTCGQAPWTGCNPCPRPRGHKGQHHNGTMAWSTSSAGAEACNATPRGGNDGTQCELPRGHRGLHESDGMAFRRESRRGAK